MSIEFPQEEITKILVSHVSAQYPSIDLILMYGSRAKGIASPRSDLEFIAIVDDETKVSVEVMFNAIGVDIWTTTWDYLEKLSMIDTYWCLPAGSFATAKVVYSRTDGKEARFETIREKLKQPLDYADKNLDYANDFFSKLFEPLGRLQLAGFHQDLHQARDACWLIIIYSTRILSRVNNQYLLNNWGVNLYEVFEFKHIPVDFRILVHDLAASDNFEVLYHSAVQLVENMRMLLIELNRDRKVEDLKYDFIDNTTKVGNSTSYSYLNKMRKAIDTSDILGASYAVHDFQIPILQDVIKLQGSWTKAHQFQLYHELVQFDKFEDFYPIISRQDFAELRVMVDRYEKEYGDYLQEIRRAVPEVSSLEELISFLENNES